MPTEETQVVDPAAIEAPPAAVVADPAPVEDAALEAPPAPAQKMVPLETMLERLGRESEGKRRESERASAAEKRAADAEAMLQRLQAAKPGDPPQAPSQSRQEPPGGRDAEIRQAAAGLKFQEDTQAVLNAGTTQFGAAPFQESLRILTALGATANDFVEDVFAVDKANAHVLLKDLAANPERAAALTNMSSRQRIAELTRMQMAAAAAAKTETTAETKPAAPAKQVSKAPPPAPALQPSTSKTVDGYSDEASDAQFTEEFNRRLKARARR